MYHNISIPSILVPSIEYNQKHDVHSNNNNNNKLRINEKIIFQKSTVPSVITSDIKLNTNSSEIGSGIGSEIGSSIGSEIGSGSLFFIANANFNFNDDEMYISRIKDIVDKFRNREEYEISTRVNEQVVFILNCYSIMLTIFIMMYLP